MRYSESRQILCYRAHAQALPRGRSSSSLAAAIARRDRGQVLVALALSIVVILIGAGLAADVGYMQRQKQRMQVAADAAAIAGASALLTNATSPSAAGENDAALNGFTAGSGVTVTINNPPQSGNFASNSSYVEAIIDQPQPTWFLSMLGLKTLDVSARAVAGTTNADGCLYVLDPSQSGALTANGNDKITSQCGVLVDSSSTSALIANGHVTIAASAIGVVGNALTNGNVSLTPTPITGIVPVSDPLASVPQPFVGSCTHSNFILNGNQSVQMSPGVYCGGIIFNGNSKANFAPGVYVLRGGGMIVNGRCTLNGSGVTFFNTTGTGGYRPIIMNGNVTATLSAPTSGPLKGILFFQDRAIGNGAGSIINGGADANFSGALYFPTTSLTYNGGGNAAYSIIVSKDLTVNGNVSMNADYSSLQGGSPIQNATLAE
ncbi:MAG TPA: pilus assembly protein TadG-related protein [Candidatus Binataceae bacterium]|nr:pilus assembly protein TadG-related protein [Candidatus Binataceae bacterium]